MRILLTTTWLCIATVLVGCEGNAPSGPSPAEPAAAAPPRRTGRAAASAPATAEPSTADDGPVDDGTVEKASGGVGAKGRDYGGPGFVTTPIETLFRIEDRIVFEAQIPNTMKIYKAEHNNKAPKNQEEFMQVIIKDGGITLPELPGGDVYWYDPKTEELMVRHPKQ